MAEEVKEKISEMKNQWTVVIQDEMYQFLKWNPECRKILAMLYDQKISIGKAIEEITKVKLGFKTYLPEG